MNKVNLKIDIFKKLQKDVDNKLLQMIKISLYKVVYTKLFILNEYIYELMQMGNNIITVLL